jgi:hypothetical protein
VDHTSGFRSNPALQRPSASFLSLLARCEWRLPHGGLSLPPRDSPIPSTFDSQQSTVLLSQRVRINIIPFQLAILCFHTSYALFCTTQIANTRIFSHFHTLCAKHRAWGMPSQPLRAPLLLLTTHYPLLTPPCTLFPSAFSLDRPLRSQAPCLKKTS